MCPKSNHNVLVREAGGDYTPRGRQCVQAEQRQQPGSAGSHQELKEAGDRFFPRAPTQSVALADFQLLASRIVRK